MKIRPEYIDNLRFDGKCGNFTFVKLAHYSILSYSYYYQVIPEESWGCSALSGLEINVSTAGQNGLPRTLSFDTMAGTANIEELEDCTTYDINAAFRNEDELGISSEMLSVSTSLIRKNICVFFVYNYLR